MKTGVLIAIPLAVILLLVVVVDWTWELAIKNGYLRRRQRKQLRAMEQKLEQMGRELAAVQAKNRKLHVANMGQMWKLEQMQKELDKKNLLLNQKWNRTREVDADVG